jgi:flavorubredoxin
MTDTGTVIGEIADDIFRISTFSPAGPPGGITFNQFFIRDDEPVLIHTGMRIHFAQTLEAVRRVVRPESLRWITSNHASRPDELGALNDWFGVAPRAQVVHGQTACRVNLVDVVDRPLRPMPDGERLTIGTHTLRWIATPHMPGPWESGAWFDETTETLFTGDVFAQSGPAVPLTDADIVAAAIAHDQHGRGNAYTPTTAPILRSLAELAPTTLALMHGPAYRGDGAAALNALADHFADQLLVGAG